MPKNGKLATATAATLNDLYDTLTADDQSVWDQIGTLGYVPEQGSTGLWLAKKRSDPDGRTIGPANSLKALRDRVKEEVDEAAEFDNDVESAGSKRRAVPDDERR
jgi:hypothetical protein